MEGTADLAVFVYTGDRRYAGTNSKIHIRLHAEDGKTTNAINLNNAFTNDFEQASIDCFRVTGKDVEGLDRFVRIKYVEVWKDKLMYLFSDDWFVDKIVVENKASNESFVFPFFRWIKNNYQYKIKLFDTSLPQNDEFSEQREKELSEKRETYQYQQKHPNFPVQVKSMPPDEEFTFDYQWDLTKDTLILGMKSKLDGLIADKWDTTNDMKKLHTKNDTFGIPRNADWWDTDENFARQRLAGMDPCLITRVRSKLPDKFPVTDKLIGRLLEGMTIDEAIKKNKLFIIDLAILQFSIPKEGRTVCTPFALFFVNSKEELKPVAIQLFQEPDPENPIFTPEDPPMLWKFVKMWYNNAESAHHQSLAHLGLTHCLCEGFTISTHRRLSVTHPVFKLLAPHFLFMIAINWRGLPALFGEGGLMETTMNLRGDGILTLIAEGFDKWRMDVDGLVPENLKARGVEDPTFLPSYTYADDATRLFKAINTYVRSYVNLYYKNDNNVLKQDKEIQAWVAEIVREIGHPDGGLGVKGVPGNGRLNDVEDLVKILSSMIYTCSVMHAAVNFGQYDTYGFPPNYPMSFKKSPPTSKDANITESDLVASIPNEKESLMIMTISTALSRRGTYNLGNFEMQYIFDPEALAVVHTFRQELSEISEEIKKRNTGLEHPYDTLDPAIIPNSISI